MPFRVEAAPLIVFGLSLVAVMAVLRTWDLMREPAALSTGQRVWHLFALFDTRLIGRIPRVVLWRCWARALVAAGVTAGAVALTLTSTDLAGPARWATRYGGAALLMLALFEACSPLVRGLWGLFGVDPPGMHDAPYLSRSVQEFWGARWNRIISTWLRENCYAPLAARGHPRFGVIWAFAFSGLFHTYMVLTALGGEWAVVFGAFFFLQIALVQIERRLGVRRWPAAAGHAWTVIVMLAVSPLFTEPVVLMLEGSAL